MLRKLLPALAIVALTSGFALAQPVTQSSTQSSSSPSPASESTTVGIPLNPQRPLTQEEIDKQRAADRAYNAAIQKIPDKKPSGDPWGNIRPSSSTAAKTKQQ